MQFRVHPVPSQKTWIVHTGDSNRRLERQSVILNVPAVTNNCEPGEAVDGCATFWFEGQYKELLDTGDTVVIN